MPMTVDERLDMLQSASRAWLELRRLLDAIPDEVMERPHTVGSWTGKDLLGHLAGWEALAIDIINELDERGDSTPLAVNPETIDVLNEEMLVPYRALPTSEVRRALEDTHLALMDVAERSPDVRADIVIHVTRDHYNEHVDDVRRLAR